MRLFCACTGDEIIVDEIRRFAAAQIPRTTRKPGKFLRDSTSILLPHSTNARTDSAIFPGGAGALAAE
jgi:hypothetical protein